MMRILGFGGYGGSEDLCLERLATVYWSDFGRFESLNTGKFLSCKGFCEAEVTSLTKSGGVL